jgi:hypothetical protein
MGEVRVSGFSLPRKWPTLATMTIVKIGYPVAVVRSDVGRTSSAASWKIGQFVNESKATTRSKSLRA